MIQFREIYLSALIAISSTMMITGQINSVNVDTLDNYQGWGWEVLLVNNDYITLAVVPSIGGRILQYDLLTDTFMIVNESLFGEVFYDDSDSPWSGTWGYGGYKTWPAPQDRWSWPPPPTLAWGNYNYTVKQYGADSLCISLFGQTETVRAPGLRFNGYITLYRNSTRVRIATSLINDSDANQDWAIWDVTQTIVQHESAGDFENFSAYFPVSRPQDIWGDGPEAYDMGEGIYRAVFNGNSGKKFAVATDGWVVFTDERDAQSYAKVFDIIEGADYSDEGAMVQIYTNGGSRYMEVEVLGPIESIGPDGDSIVFIEDWYVTSSAGAPVNVGHAGIVKESIQYNQASKRIRGVYALFAEGQAYAAFYDGDGELLGSSDTVEVQPLIPLEVDLQSELPDGTVTIELHFQDIFGSAPIVLDSHELSQNDDFTARRANEDPSIDGIGDESFWTHAAWYPLEHVWIPYDELVPETDFSGQFKISWTPEELLLLVEIQDDSLYDGHPDPLQNYWDDDCVEVFIDEDHSGGWHENNFNAFAYHVSLDFDVADLGPSGATLFNDHIRGARTEQDGKYVWELAIRIYSDDYESTAVSSPVVLSHEKTMGFSLAYCDNDGSTYRENFIGSKYLPESQANASYQDASVFGTLTLTDPNPEPPDLAGNVNEDFYRIYPNPANDRIIIESQFPVTEKWAIQIFDLTGRLILSNRIEQGQSQLILPAGNMNPGHYFLKINTGKSIAVESIIIR